MGGRIWAAPLPKGAEFGFSIPAYVDELDAMPATDEPGHVFDRAPEANGTGGAHDGAAHPGSGSGSGPQEAPATA
jgi:hypothetical protein